MMKLVDEPDLAAPQRRTGLVSHADGRHAGDIDLTAVRPLKQPGNMQQRRFAGAGGRDQRRRLAGPQAKVGAAQDLQRSARLFVAAFDLFQIKRRRSGHGYS